MLGNVAVNYPSHTTPTCTDPGRSHSLLMTAAGEEISRLRELNQQLLEETQGGGGGGRAQ